MAQAADFLTVKGAPKDCINCGGQLCAQDMNWRQTGLRVCTSCLPAYAEAQAWERRVKEQHANNRRRVKALGAPGSHTLAQWVELCARASGRCLCCKKQEPAINLTIDHVIPLELGGSDDIGNIQPLCLACNASKGLNKTRYKLK